MREWGCGVHGNEARGESAEWRGGGQEGLVALRAAARCCATHEGDTELEPVVLGVAVPLSVGLGVP